MEKQKIRAVIFDLDGTLLDTAKDIGAGANLALHRFGFPEHSREEYVGFIGHGIRELLRLACPADCTEQQYEEVVRFYLAYYPEHCTEKTVPFPGIMDMMRKLQEAGYILGILSNKTETTTLRIVNYFFPEIPFRVVWGNNGVRLLKPAPDAGIALTETLGLKQEEIMYVGDGESDMTFASKMGFAAVAATWGYRPRQELIDNGAEVLLEKAEDLLGLLGLQ